MGAIKYDGWGWTWREGFNPRTYFAFPAQPGCSHWESDADDIGDFYLKHSVRVFADVGDDDDWTLWAHSSSGWSMTKLLSQADPAAWDAALYTNAQTQADFPDDPIGIDGYSKKTYLPYFEGYIDVMPTPGVGADLIVYGFEMFVRHPDAYDGDDCIVTDYSDGEFYAKDHPASSLVAKSMLAHGTNAITYNATYRIGLVLGPV